MRKASSVDKEIWGKKGQLLSYLMEAKEMMKKDQMKRALEES
jgi:hypothetical protein